jgi:hypothetical protein
MACNEFKMNKGCGLEEQTTLACEMCWIFIMYSDELFYPFTSICTHSIHSLFHTNSESELGQLL